MVNSNLNCLLISSSTIFFDALDLGRTCIVSPGIALKLAFSSSFDEVFRSRTSYVRVWVPRRQKLAFPSREQSLLHLDANDAIQKYFKIAVDILRRRPRGQQH